MLQVYYNNMLSLAPLAFLAAASGELGRLPSQPALRNPEFLVVAGIGGLLGFAISFTMLWYMSRSSATVFCLTVSVISWDGVGVQGASFGPEELVRQAWGETCLAEPAIFGGALSF
jgi:hypothetical protein